MKLKGKKILVTGACGFIGSHVSIKLLELNYNVVGVDIMNNYYDVEIKEKNIPHSLINRKYLRSIA